MKKTTRQVPRLSAQFDLFHGLPSDESVRRVSSAVESGRRFISGNQDALFVGTKPLAQYLGDVGESTPP